MTIKEWFAQPKVLRMVFALLRKLPVLTFGGTAIVCRHRDVVEVLSKDEAFTIAEINGKRMERVSGPFVLGMDRSPQHDFELQAIRDVFHPGDLETIRRIVRREGEDLLRRAERFGRINVAGSYCRVVATRVVAEYFGVPGPTEATLATWMRWLFRDVFLNAGEDPVVRKGADQSASELRAYLEREIVARKGGTADDLLSRLIRAGTLDDDAVRRNITGIVVGAVDTTTTAASNVILELLDNPLALQCASDAAHSGDFDQLRKCCYEALRFRPQTLALLRYSQRNARLSSGSKIRARSNVALLTLSAMFDPEAFPNPDGFDPNRPEGDYLHFGHGLHPCYGRLINGVMIPELVGLLVIKPKLRHPSGQDAEVIFDGPFPERLMVDFEAGCS